MAEGGATTRDGQDLSVSLVRANVLTLVIATPLVGLMLLAYRLVAPGHRGLAVGVGLPSILLFLVLFAIGIVVHEAIHGLAWALFGRLPLRRIHFGIQAATLTPYAHALDPMPAGAYRLGALMPALLVGVLPFAIGTLAGSPWLALYGIVFVFAAGGDLLVLWLIRGVDPGALVLDHPSRAGCIVLPPPG